MRVAVGISLCVGVGEGGGSRVLVGGNIVNVGDGLSETFVAVVSAAGMAENCLLTQGIPKTKIEMIASTPMTATTTFGEGLARGAAFFFNLLTGTGTSILCASDNTLSIAAMKAFMFS